jgi:hypothetical protein
VLHLERARFRYTPFPIGVAPGVFDPGTYKALLEAYPPLEYFTALPEVGRKLVLSEKYDGRQYRRFIASTPVWQEFHGWIKSPAFVDAVDEVLQRNLIDVGLRAYRASAALRWAKLLRDVFAMGRLPRVHPQLHTRFEFSMLPSDGGCVLPHTDSPGKLITLVVSMVAEGEWDPSHGGGTDVNQPRDPRRSYNQLNRNLAFDEVEVLDTFDFVPNQCVLFVKTFNSLHSVRPIRAPGPRRMRRTLTINIEADA